MRIRVALVAVIALLLAACAGVRPGSSKPNFVILFCDDLGYGDLGCYGHPLIKTPNLDKLASQGIRLTSAYAGMPVCSPSRAVLQTGRICQREGINDWIPEDSGIHLKKTAITVPMLLKKVGYATCLTGKWHLNSRMDGTEPLPGDHGYDHWFATQNNAKPNHENPVNFVRNGEPVGPMTGFSSTIIVDEAIDWLGRRDRHKPFFLYVAFHSPHEPVATAEEFVEQYRDAEPEDRAQHHGNVAQLDHEVGRFMEFLDGQGLGESTLVFFSSDNGPETLMRYKGANRSYGSPGKLRGMKLWLYEGGIRVPGILRWTGRIKSGQESDEPVGVRDVLPTLCELAGVPVPTDRPIDGASFVPVLSGGKVERTTPLYWQYTKYWKDYTKWHTNIKVMRPMYVLRDGDWKVLAYDGLERWELYNLRTDVEEKNDLSEKEPARLEELKKKLLKLYKEIN